MSQDSQGLSAILNLLSDGVLAKARPACQPQPFTMLSDSRARQAFNHRMEAKRGQGWCLPSAFPLFFSVVTPMS